MRPSLSLFLWHSHILSPSSLSLVPHSSIFWLFRWPCPWSSRQSTAVRDLELETEASDHQGAAKPKAWVQVGPLVQGICRAEAETKAGDGDPVFARLHYSQSFIQSLMPLPAIVGCP